MCLTGSVLTGLVPAEDVERKFQHLASSVHKVGMVLDSVQNDGMQLSRAMKEAALDCKSQLIPEFGTAEVALCFELLHFNYVLAALKACICHV